MAHWSDRLPRHACEDAVAWANTQPSIKTAWENCERGDWMLWLLGQNVKQQGDTRHRKLVLAACKCARLAWEWMPKASGVVIEQLEQWAAGDDSINLAAVRKAAYAADAADYADYATDAVAAATADYVADAVAAAAATAAAAADAADADVADAAAYAADAADYAAAYAADAVAAAAADYAVAADAADAAAYADYAAAYAAAYTAADARFGLRKQCANIVREMYSVRDVYIILKKKLD